MIAKKKAAKKRTLAKEQGWRCRYCGKPLTQQNATLDHVVPKCAGGTWANRNLVLACWHCNQKKASKLPHQWGPAKAALMA